MSSIFHNSKHELAQEATINAAADPRSSVTSTDAQRSIVEESKRAGAEAFQFDPDATPEQKAAQARAHIPPDFHHEKKPVALGVVSDMDGGKPDYDLPSPTKAGAMAAPGENGEGLPNGYVEEDMRYARDRTGWAPRFGAGDPADDEGENLLDHQTWVEQKLEDKWFGDWYYNAGVIIFACLATYVGTLLGAGLAWVLIVMAVCSTYYRTSLRRVRRNFRDDVHRELAKQRLETDSESLEWMNSFLVKFWPIYQPVLAETIINSVDQVLSTSTPAFLEGLRMKTFTLGTKPPRLEHVKTYPKAEDDTVLMDWKFSFNPNDTIDMTQRQLKNKINPKVVLEVRIGKGIISKGLDVIVEDFAFSGLMRVKVKLQIPFPHVEKAEMCFLERPAIDYVCKPLGGDTFGFDINFVPGLEGFIQEQIHGNLAPIMYAPNVFPIEIAKMLSGDAVDQAVGVVQITLHSGQGLKNPDKYPGIPDPYVVVSINNRDVLGKTKTVVQSSNPKWNETINVIVTTLKDSLTLTSYDYNEFRKDKELGTATFALERLEEESVHENIPLELTAGGKARGLVMADIRYFPVLQGEKLPDGSLGPAPESNTGIAKFMVEQAKELDGSKSLVGKLNPYAVLLLNGKEVHTSQVMKRTNNPIFPNATKEFLISDRKSAKLGLVIKDARDLGQDPILGMYQIKLNDMVDLMTKGQEWFNLSGTTAGRVKMTLQWKPTALKGGSSGTGGYIKPIGVMRLHFQNARELRNVETMGKSDPYVRVLLSGIEKGRTVTFQNNLNPDWDEVIYVPMHSDRERLVLEVMDSENIGKDRTLGLTQIQANEFIKQDENGEYLVCEQKGVRSETLKLSGKGSSKGILNYSCSFYPTHNVFDPEEDEEKKETDDATAEAGESTDSLRKPASILPSHSASPSQDMTELLDQGEAEQDETTEVKEAPKIKVTPEDVSQYESGLLVFKLLDADLSHQDCYIEVVMDDQAFPSYVSSKARSRQMTFHETGDAMVRELDVSRIELRLREKVGSEDEDHIYAKMTGFTLDVLKRGLYQTTPLVLRGDDGRESRVNFNMKYLPIKMKLDQSESINNSGSLRVDVLDARDLPAADRNGYSDPYCKFKVGDSQVFKTQTQKKTLHPSWNEFFECQIPSRTANNFKVEVFDWDRGDKDDFLGGAIVDLAGLEPLESKEVQVGLDGASGAVRLRLLFKPAFVTRMRQGTSAMSGTFAVPGKVIGAPVKGVGKGAMFVGGGIARTATFLGHGFRRNKSQGGNESAADVNGGAGAPVIDGPVPRIPNVIDSYPPSAAPRSIVDGQSPASPTHARGVSRGADSTHSAMTTAGGSGSATISILNASGYEGANVRVVVKQQGVKGAREVHKTKSHKSSSSRRSALTSPARLSRSTAFRMLASF